MGENVGYIIAPMGLTERQYLIYLTLYKKCNFSDMTVKYTLDQIAADIKLTDLTKKIVNNEIKKFIEKGYIKLLKRGTKGNPSIFQIVKINEINGNELVTNRERIGNLKHSNVKGLSVIDGTNRERIGNELVTPIKEKEKDIYIYSLVIDYLNKKAGTKFKSTTKATRELIDLRVSEGFESRDFFKVIDVKCEEWLGNPTMSIYIRPETLFSDKFESYLNQSREIKQLSVSSNGIRSFK